MKSLLFPLAFCIAGALAAPTEAKQINNGSYWTDGAGTTVRVDIVDDAAPGVAVQVVDATGFSGSVTGTASSGSSAEHPSATSFPSATTNAPEGSGNTYRGAVVENEEGDHESAVQKKNASGEWVTLTRKKKTKKHGMDGDFGSHGSGDGNHEQVVSLPWTLYDVVRFSDYYDN